MKNKGDAHGTLFPFFSIYGVSTKMVMDGSKEQALGFFRNKLQEANFHIK